MLMRRHYKQPEPEQSGEGVPDYPEGEPSEGWKADQLRAYAKAHEVDLGSATKKADMVAAISAATVEPVVFDPSEHEPEQVLEYLAGLDDEDTEAHDAEVARVVQAERDGQNRDKLLEQIEGTPES